MRTYILNFIKYKDLFIELVIRDIKIKYRNSFLGILWSMINPLLMMIVFSIVFMELFKNDIPNFPVYVLIGRILYQFFSEATSFAMEAVYANGQLINKLYVPKYFFPLTRVLSSFIISFLSLVPLLLVIMPLTGLSYDWINLMIIFPLVYLLLISTGIGLLLSALNVFFSDIKHLYSVLLVILMFLTPIFYPMEIIPEKYAIVLELNPLHIAIEMFRDVIMYGVLPNFDAHLSLIIYSLLFTVIGIIVFGKTQDRFIYKL